MGSPLPWSCVPCPPPSTRHHVQVQSRFTTYQVVIILILTNCISNESRSLSTFVHYRGDLMQCGVGKPFNIPSAKLGIHHHHTIDIIVTMIAIKIMTMIHLRCRHVCLREHICEKFLQDRRCENGKRQNNNFPVLSASAQILQIRMMCNLY